MSKLEMNHVVPNFDLPGTSETNFSLKNYLGKLVILYFYPRDSTQVARMKELILRTFTKILKKRMLKSLGYLEIALNHMKNLRKSIIFLLSY